LALGTRVRGRGHPYECRRARGIPNTVLSPTPAGRAPDPHTCTYAHAQTQQFLQKLTQKAKDRYIPIAEIAAFKKVRKMTTSWSLVVKAMQGNVVWPFLWAELR